MPVTTDDLVFKITVDADGAVKGISGVTDELGDLGDETSDVDKEMSDLSKTFGSIGASAVVLNQGLELATKAYQAMIGPIKESIELFGIQEKAELRLANALALTTGFNQKAMDSFTDFASELQGVTEIGDETTLSLLSLAVAAGRTSDEAEKLLTVSADLAAGTDKDLRTSFEALLSTLKGESGELQKYDKSLANLSKQALQSGKAIDILGQRFKDFARVSADTFAGLKTQVSNAFGDVEEEVGKTLVEAFNLKDKLKGQKEFLEGLAETIKDLRPAVVDTSKAFSNLGTSLANAFSRIGAGFSSLFGLEESLDNAAESSISLKEAINDLETFVNNIAAAIDRIDFEGIIEKSEALLIVLSALAAPSIVSSIIALAGAIGALAIPVLLVTAKILLIAGAIVAVVAAIDIMMRNWDLFTKDFDDTVQFMGDVWDKMVAEMVVAFLGTLAEMADGMTDFASIFSDDLSESLSGFSKDAKQTVSELEEEINNINVDSAIKFDEIDTGLIGEIMDQAKNAMDGFKDSMFESTAAAGDLEDKLKDDADAAAKLTKEMTAVVKELLAANAALEVDIAMMGAGPLEKIELQKQAALAILDTKEKQLAIDGLLSAEAADLLEKQRELVGLKADKTAAASQNVVSPDTIGSIKEAFGEGAADFVSGIGAAIGQFANPIGALKAAGSAIADALIGIINFLPDMINKFADVFSALNEFPEKLISAVSRLFSEFGKIFSETIENLITMIPTLLMDAITFVFQTFPQILMDLVENLPVILIDGFLDKLPEIVTGLITGLVSNMPKLVIGLVTGLVKAAPMIAKALFETLYIDIPKAIISGLIEGIAEIGKAISSIFTGQKISFDTKQIEDTVNNIGETISKATEDVFTLLDLDAAAKGFAQAEAIGEAINDAMDNAKDIWDKMLAGLKAAWMFVWDKIIMPIFNLIRDAWLWVNEKVIQPILKIVQQAFQWVIDKILTPLAGLVSKAFSAAVKLITDAFNFVKEKLFDPWVNSVKAIFMFVKEKIFDPYINGLTSIFNKLKEVGTTIWNGFKKGFEGLGELLNKAFDAISPANLLEKLFPSDTSGKGTVETALGVDIPFANFADGGVVGGTAKVAGDSLANDLIPALLSPDEVVIPRSMTKIPEVMKILMAILSGEIPRQFAFGGSIGEAFSSATGGGGDGGLFGGIDPRDISVEDIENLGDDAVKGIEQLAEVLSGADLLDKFKDKIFDELISGLKKNFGFEKGGPIDATGPAFVHEGEFVVNSSGRQTAGDAALNQLNQGRLPGSQAPAQNISIEMNITTQENVNERELADNIISTIKEQSIQGRFVIDTAGIRTTA